MYKGHNRLRQEKNYGEAIVGKSRTVPDQSMSIAEIVKRYVRGIPIDAVQRTPVYIDQQEMDLERASRMDFAEKADLAAEMAEKRAELEQQMADNKRQLEARRRQQAANHASTPPDKNGGTGIDSLDNTMPVDTKLSNK